MYSIGGRTRCNNVIKSLNESFNNNRVTTSVKPYIVSNNAESNGENNKSTKPKALLTLLPHIRQSHLFAAYDQVHEKTIPTTGVPSDCTTPVPREILKVGERQYSVRVGNGADPPVLLLDGTEPGCIAIQFNIMDESCPELDDIKISTYSKDKVQPYVKQTDMYSVHKIEDILNFMFRTKDSNLKCCLTLYFGNGVYLGRSFLSLDHSSFLENVKLPIINDTHTIVGILNCSIVEVSGLDDNCTDPKEVVSPSTSQEIKHNHCDVTTTLEIGHRGCGVTETDRQLFTELPCLAENTVASLTMAHKHGADMVETDVVVTQDLKAVLHHDLEIELSGTRKVPISHVASNVLEGIPPLPLSVDERQIGQQLLLNEQDSAGLESIQTQNKMFPYLSDILTSLPHSLGLLLEVKASLPEVGVETANYHTDRNSYIDVILKEMFSYAADRNIMLCSFCPITCTLLRNKQDRWPVVLILQGSTEIYPDYVDQRLRCLQTSINFAISENLHGVSLFTGLLQDNPKAVIDGVKKAGLKSYVWGFHNCEKKFRAQMRQCGVDGLIYDRIYEEDLSKRTSSNTA